MQNFQWWQKEVLYQVYPRSFADSNHDGIGDLQGLFGKLDYLQELGVGAIWLSPLYPSPLIDCGYDISDYCDVAPEYGTLDEFKVLLQEIHARKMHLVLDLVLNHTSDQHPWFVESRSSTNNKKRDWYIWEKGTPKEPPNDWYATFGGSAWELDPKTNEYYYHFFFKEQPDLNWRNPEVKNAMFDVVRYWLDMGVDGFRLDAIGTIFEDPALPAHNHSLTLDKLYEMNRRARTETEKKAIPPLWEDLFHYQHDQLGIHELMRELRQVVDEYEDRVLIGETDDTSFYGKGTDELHMVFNFPLMRNEKLAPDNILSNQRERIASMPKDAWAANTLGNHDCPRMFNRFGNGKNDLELARLHLALIMSLRGTPVLYNGEEIGMTDFLDMPLDQFRDPLSTHAYTLEKTLMGATEKEALKFGVLEGRDKCRTPMQWSASGNAGFCPAYVTPWLSVNPNFMEKINVSEQDKDPSSMLNYYRSFIRFRNQHTALVMGDYFPIQNENPRLLTFERLADDERILCLFNFGAEKAHFILGDDLPNQILYSTINITFPAGTQQINLRPFEAIYLSKRV